MCPALSPPLTAPLGKGYSQVCAEATELGAFFSDIKVHNLMKKGKKTKHKRIRNVLFILNCLTFCHPAWYAGSKLPMKCKEFEWLFEGQGHNNG